MGTLQYHVLEPSILVKISAFLPVQSKYKTVLWYDTDIVKQGQCSSEAEG